MHATSPKHFHSRYFGGEREPKKVTDKMLLGSLVHCLFLTPDIFDQDFFVMGNYDGRTKEGKAYREEALLACGTRQLVTKDLVDQAQLIVEALKLKFYPWMSSYLAELSFFWQCPFSQLWMRGRADAVMGDTLIELKTTDNAEPQHFSKHIFNMNYDLSLYHYVEGLRQCGLEIKKCVFIVVETASPYVCEKYIAGDGFLATGHDKWLDAVTKLETGLADLHWPSYADPLVVDELVLSPPAWAMKGKIDET